MPTTTNYGWTTPADTDLVKDGAAAIRTLGSSIDTTVFANASAGIPKTIVDAKGDLIAATAADTVARLAVGTNDQVLTADSTAATGMAWKTSASGGMTLLSTTTLTGTSVTISSINQTYNELLILFSDVTFSSATRIRVFPNNGNVRSGGWDATSSSGFSTGGSFGQADFSSQFAMLQIENYASTTTRKIGFFSAGTPSVTGAIIGSFFTDQTAAVTSLVVTTNSGASFTAGTVQIYGVK